MTAPRMLAPQPPETAQPVFRAVLDALARPGILTRLPAGGAVPPALLPVLGLADLDTPVAILSDEDWSDPVGTATGAPITGPAQARFVAALRSPAADEVAGFPVGSAASPEAGALVSLAVPELTGGPQRTLRGPGIPQCRAVAPRGVGPQVWAARAGAAFPAGFDLLLVDPDGRVLGIPRSTRIEED
ncbi:phosphonate C-P lyase system protein PhnH [Pseudonocardia parietis]|uniref:Alpha-D-ribose 1-methylphosphonate 5-triphosphate synthase subunit PhnH n=1 Tax=Pseudonocardia parietis TaxID=570936 RepID=A0ABS4W735_9PSEU|nr:phosphonate C-P lyase system protein PhnH [Pseudonocardia parietis]MBP2371801.1 alpha-D-ribose 1-methylphosphonate 5-triphosphate synthase subunit PhnH [Pseudonocardia parietis]